jgi:pimeloyl-ACP methyl ester carboxylesterase
VVPFVEREGGVRLHWQQSGEGPGVLAAYSYIQHPDVLKPLLAELQEGHRLITYDARGAGESTRQGPYDMATDVADLIAIAEEASPLAALVANGDATNRAVHAAAQRPELIPYVVSMESMPISPRQAAATDSLISSASVLEALVGMMRADYRSGLNAAIERGNPDWTPQQIRQRVDAIVAYIDHDASVARLDEWIRDEPGDDPLTLGDRLVVAYEGAGGWFPADLTELGSKALPEARFEKLERGALTRPDLTAAVVRSVTGVEAPAR